MAETILDASAAEFDDFDLTGEVEDLSTQETNENSNQEDLSNQEDNSSENSENLENSENSENNNEGNAEDDFTMEVLRLKGIQDPSKIKFQDDSGAIIERDWNDLTDNERLNILVNNEDPETDLEEDEIMLINTLRENNLTPQQYIQAIQQQAAQQALAQYQDSQVPVYEIDSLSDDELFALDLLEKVGDENITDEELKEALEQAKSNEALFAKQIEGLRTTYKNLEDQQKYDAEQAQIEQAEQQYQEFSNQVLNQIGSFNTFANQEIELSTDDKNDLANYMLTRRETGISDFYRDMQDPQVATLAAFWLIKGPEVLNEMEGQIRAAYQRGYSVGSTKQRAQRIPSATPKTPQVVVQEPAKKDSTNNDDFQSAFGLEDESYLN